MKKLKTTKQNVFTKIKKQNHKIEQKTTTFYYIQNNFGHKQIMTKFEGKIMILTKQKVVARSEYNLRKYYV